MFLKASLDHILQTVCVQIYIGHTENIKNKLLNNYKCVMFLQTNVWQNGKVSLFNTGFSFQL